MAEIAGPHAPNVEDIKILRERYRCPYFRILVIGRANAGKTTILEKVCGVAKGTTPIILDKEGKELVSSAIHLMPSMERGIHDIEHGITYDGSNFIFHDSQGFESGAKEEIEVVWDFIAKQSSKDKLKDQLHAIWYCIPMDSARPILPTELEFFDKGIGKVPLVAVFTKFDAQIIQECGKLDDTEDKWDKARKNAEIAFQNVYLPKVFDTKYPPKGYVCLEDMDIVENDCPELTEQTANAIDEVSIQELFVSIQRNNLDLCVKFGLNHALLPNEKFQWEDVFIIVLSKFPHYWIMREDDHNAVDWFDKADEAANFERNYYVDYPKYSVGGTASSHSGSHTHYMTYQSTAGYGGKGNVNNDERGQRKDLLNREILPELFSVFGEHSTFFSATATACQVLAAMNIIAKLSFPMKTAFEQSIRDALDQFKRQDYTDKLKTCITSESMPSDQKALSTFLYDNIAHI